MPWVDWFRSRCQQIDGHKADRLVMVVLVLSLVLGAGAAVYTALAGPDEQTPTIPQAEQRKRAVYAAEAPEAKALFHRMDPHRPGDWLAVRPEPGQTFEEYQHQVFNRKTPTRHTIYIVPLGPFIPVQQRVLGEMARYAKAFFDCPTRLLSGRALPSTAYVKHRRQYNGSAILDWLERTRPEDAVALVGVTGQDLFADRLNFVFGLGSLGERTGVYSLHRYGQTYDVLLKRALKVMNHELGHIFSLRHCIFYDCSMNGSNSLRESDGRPIHYCPVCHAKLQWAIGFSPHKRLRALQRYYRSAGLTEEADFVRRRLALNP